MRQRQLQLFTVAEVAAMRDRTLRRNYSPEGEEFRRTHQRHRSWGLAQRHAERLRQVREKARGSGAARGEQRPPGRRPAARPGGPTSTPPSAKGCHPAASTREQTSRAAREQTSRPAPSHPPVRGQDPRPSLCRRTSRSELAGARRPPTASVERVPNGDTRESSTGVTPPAPSRRAMPAVHPKPVSSETSVRRRVGRHPARHTPDVRRGNVHVALCGHASPGRVTSSVRPHSRACDAIGSRRCRGRSPPIRRRSH